jgi:hypothetical protein
MRHSLVATGILFIAVNTYAQTKATATTVTVSPAAQAATADTAPPLTKSVKIEAGDSPLVRAAKLAVASRQHPSNRRVITVTPGGSAGRGRYAEATGPVNGPSIPAAESTPAPQQSQWQREEAAKAEREAAAKERLRQLEQAQQVVGAEVDEPYGGDIEEDAVEATLTGIAAERQDIAPPPPPQQ